MVDPLAIKPGLGNPLSFSMCKPSMARSEISRYGFSMGFLVEPHCPNNCPGPGIPGGLRRPNDLKLHLSCESQKMPAEMLTYYATTLAYTCTHTHTSTHTHTHTYTHTYIYIYIWCLSLLCFSFLFFYFLFFPFFSVFLSLFLSFSLSFFLSLFLSFFLYFLIFSETYRYNITYMWAHIQI